MKDGLEQKAVTSCAEMWDANVELSPNNDKNPNG